MLVKARRTAIYARISTDDTRQNSATQLRQLREYAAHRGFQIVGEYLDFASGRYTDRTRYKQLIETVRKRQVDVVLVFHYDRLARSTIELITRVEEFHRLGIDFISYQQHVDITTDIGKLYFTIRGASRGEQSNSAEVYVSQCQADICTLFWNICIAFCIFATSLVIHTDRCA